MDCSGATWKIVSGAPTCDKCPSTAPVAGAACAASAGKLCSYTKGCCTDDYQCFQGKWASVPVSCNPPPPICPTAPPQPGTACDPCASTGECSYDTCSTLGKLTKASCVSGSWAVTGSACAADAGTD
jgi:hypothetical protein